MKFSKRDSQFYTTCLEIGSNKNKYKMEYNCFHHFFTILKVKGSIMILTRVILAFLVFFISNLLYNVMFIIRKYSRVDFEQLGLYELWLGIIYGGRLVYKTKLGENWKHWHSCCMKRLYCTHFITLILIRCHGKIYDLMKIADFWLISNRKYQKGDVSAVE